MTPERPEAIGTDAGGYPRRLRQKGYGGMDQSNGIGVLPLGVAQGQDDAKNEQKPTQILFRGDKTRGVWVRGAGVEEAFLTLEHVNVARGDNLVLHDINLSINKGEHLAILGPNGCGKSTLIKTITCECYPLPKPDSRVSIFGRERWDLAELKKRLGVVAPELPGRPMLGITGFEAVLTGFFSSSTLWPHLAVTHAMKDRAAEVLKRIDSEQLAGKAVGEMSAGQQRRVMIGRALVGSADMLLLDEPSNALDLAAQKDLRELLRRLAREGTGILLITHHIADILPEIDRVLMMREGRIAADGAKAELLTAEGLSELFGCEVKVTERDGFYSAW